MDKHTVYIKFKLKAMKDLSQKFHSNTVGSNLKNR